VIAPPIVHMCRSVYAYTKTHVRKSFVIVTGHEYISMESLTIDFHEAEVDNTYRAVCCPVAHNAVVYGRLTVNLSAAIFKRLFLCRTEDGFSRTRGVEFDNELFENQEQFIFSHKEVVLSWLRGFIDYFLDVGQFDKIEDNFSYCYQPHPKKNLRIQSMHELYETGRFNDRHWQKYRPSIKLKTLEFAKNLGIPRCIGDLGVAASIIGALFMSCVKEYIESKPFYYKNGVFKFVKKTSRSNLSEVFDTIYEANGSCVHCFAHSDDSIYVICQNGIKRVYNVDISKCDASHGEELFKLMEVLFMTPCGTMRILLEQLRGCVDIHSVNKKKKVTLRLLQTMLLSGSVITTTINTLANALIFMAIVDCGSYLSDDMIRAAERCGYIITTGDDVAGHYGLWQFLKHSPILLNGSMHPMINLGPYFRSFGTTKSGDFIGPSYVSVFDRFRRYQYQITIGMFGDGCTFGINAPFLTVLRDVLNVGSLPHKWEEMVARNVDPIIQYDDLISVTDVELFSRYSATEEEIAELTLEILQLTPGVSLSSPILGRILSMDYSLNVD